MNAELNLPFDAVSNYRKNKHTYIKTGIMKKFKAIKYSEKFVFDDKNSEYVFKIKKCNYRWLWLLLIALLLGLLCIRCTNDITVHVVDHVSGEPVTPTSVTIEYTEHALCKGGKLFYNNPYSKTLETDENGDALFEDMPCSVFSYIFYAFSKACLTAENDCNYLKDSPATCIFHYTWDVTLKLQPKTEDIQVLVTDKETDEPLAGAVIHYDYSLSGENVTDSVRTDAAGAVYLAGVPRCGSLHLERVSCYGYEDTTHIDLSVLEVIKDPTKAVVPLVPVKQSFTYFVKNKFTKQPVPGATVEVILTSGHGTVKRGESTTNVDGKGCGVYNDAFILADLVIKANKIHYKPGQFDRKITVKEFAELPDSSRVVYLEPEPYMEEFQNVDSITGKPIAGVRNSISVFAQNGETIEYVEISNRYGIFYVKAMEGDHIVIDSKREPQYEPKHTDIPSFDEGEKILMKPRVADLTFRTVVAGTDTLLPDCTLRIYDSEYNNYKPDNSGIGEFTLRNVPLHTNIYIVSTKAGYDDNDYSVRNKNVKYLSTAPQSERDIPMTVMIPPCNASGTGENNVKAGTVSSPVSYNMGVEHGTFEFTYQTGSSCPDQIDIYNHEMGEPYNSHSPIWSSGMEATDGERVVNISFNSGSVITIVVTTGPKDDSLWNYKVSCPK